MWKIKLENAIGKYRISLWSQKIKRVLVKDFKIKVMWKIFKNSTILKLKASVSASYSQ